MDCTSGGSVKFVSISFDNSVPVADKTVTEWTLNTATWQWTKGEELRDDFKNQGLPETEPQFPLLSTEKDGDALYFVLSEPRRLFHSPAVHHMCRFDMRSKRLLSSRLSWSPYMAFPTPLLGSEFFRYLENHHLGPVDNKGKEGMFQ
ncbi:hypothetical protein E2562_033187 [Oryza meyeriana var. granulata]|uniref:DUF1618 domain-containing protein n=1 Tax=Oryza meyeriana var. granulata TaxID=110450 RepID=A0A6G1DR20_9ORYZ|nr:hypothetical protein E2562_033187 [Oryza meyeriana var. granulata]